MHDKLIQAITRYWGGKNTKVEEAAIGVYSFRGDEGYSRYEIRLPGTFARIYEDSGRPIEGFKVPESKVLVRCLTDAPDAWWYVGLDGSYRSFRGEDINLLTEKVS